jgi:methionyl-tRNA formyltransferase
VLRVLSQLSDGTAVETPQDPAAATVAPKLSRQTAVVDWSRPAAEVARRINGLSPWPGCRVRLMDGDRDLATVTLVRSRPGHAAGAAPGTIVGDSVVAGDGRAVELLQVQPEGRRPMSPADYRNGRPWRDGIRLVAAD